MNKSVILVILLLVVLSVGGYLYTRQEPPMVTKQLPPVAQASPAAADNTNPVTTTNSLRSLIAAGGTVNCTYADTAANTAGTMKISGTQVRGDFTTSVEGKSSLSHMISDGKFMYLWSDSQGNQGMKYDLSTIPTPGATGQTPTGQSPAVDLDKQYAYQCTPWIVDTSVFTPPASIQFQDLSKLMQNLAPKVSGVPKITGTVTQGNAAACAACVNLPAAAKTQCLSTLGCN